MVKLNMILFPKTLRLTSLTSSIILSLSIVYIIHALYVFPSVTNELTLAKQHIFNQARQAIINGRSVSAVIEDFSRTKTQINIEEKKFQERIQTTDNQDDFYTQNSRYLITIIHADFIDQTHLALFGSILLLFALAFFFVRLVTLYIENTSIKQNLSSWEKKLSVISNKLDNLDNNLQDSLALIQNTAPHSFPEWEQLYNKICEFDIVLDKFRHKEDILDSYAKIKANFDYKFTNYYLKHFCRWNTTDQQRPLFINKILDDLLSRHYRNPIYFLVFDSMRVDHWLKIKPIFQRKFSDYLFDEKIAWSLLPTYTPYCRNSLLSGLTPRECAYTAYHGNLFNNQYEEKLFFQFIKQHKLTGRYIKIAEDYDHAKKIFQSNEPADITALIYMFIDGLTHSMSHTKTDESLFREHLLIEFQRNTIMDTLDMIKRQNGIIVICSDHGNILTRQTIRATQFDISGNDHQGKDLHIPERFLIGHCQVQNLSEFKTPNTHLLLDPATFNLPGDPPKNYAFCRGPFKYDAQDQKPTYQYSHGGASIYELLVPYVIIKPADM